MVQVRVKHKHRLLIDNGPSYVASELKTCLDDQGMTHTRGRPYHPMTQSKIERWHRSMKNQVLLEHYYLPGDLERRISQFVDYYNHERYQRIAGQPDSGRCLLWAWATDSEQTGEYPIKDLGAPRANALP